MPSRQLSSGPAASRLRLSLLQLAGRALPARQPTRSGTVLLMRPDHIGDVLLTSPAVALVRNSLPTAHLTYLVGPWSAEAAQRGPSVDEVRTLSFPGFTRAQNANVLAPYALLTREALRLRRADFDLAIVFRPDHWWGALLAQAAGIPIRVGGATPETSPLLTHTYTSGCHEHAAERSLGIARLALHTLRARPAETDTVRQFRVSPSARSEADVIWRRHDLAERRVVALHPSAGAPLKSWPIDNWAALADGLLASDASVLLTGALEDRTLIERIVGRMRHTGAAVACGQSLSATAALYERCTLAITVDSGAGHLAAAVGTPTIRFYGPAPPSIFGPWPLRSTDHVLLTSQLACAPCGVLESPPCGARQLPACMLALSVEDVLNTARAHLNQG